MAKTVATTVRPREDVAALRADLQKGRDELRSGLGIDGDEVFAHLEAKHPQNIGARASQR